MRYTTDNVLKIIPDPYLSDEEYNAIPRNERDNNNWWYLHGQLESDCGYDKAVAINCQSAGFSKETVDYSEIQGSTVTEIHSEEPIYRMCFDGICKVEAKNIDKPLIGFFWTSRKRSVRYKDKNYDYWNQSGLVCFEDDETAINYAYKKYLQKSPIL